MISPMPQRLLSNRIVKIGEFSENTCSKFYESSIYMSPEQRIDRYHRKLNSLSKIIDKKFPNIRSRQLDRFVLYEHGLMQAFRVVDTALKRKKMTVFKEIDSLAISRIKKRELILIILNIYKRNKLYCLDKYMKKWNKKDSFTSKYKKLCNFLVQRSFQDLNIGFGKIQVFSLQTKIKSLLYSKQMQFQQENALIEEKNKLKAKIVMLNFFNSLDNKLQFRNKKEKQRVFSKIIMKGRIIKRLEDLCRKYICLGGKKNKKIISDKIRDFFIKKRILIKLINFFKSKTLKKSFWALKHWKSYVNKGNAVKGLYFIGGMEKLLGKTKKIGFDIMKRHKNSDDLEKKIVLKHLLKTLKKKIMQRKKEVLDVLNKNSKRITEENKRKLQNSLFLSKLLQLIFQKANEKIKKDVFLSLKEKIEK